MEELEDQLDLHMDPDEFSGDLEFIAKKILEFKDKVVQKQ
jgi:hypothetical protein